MSGEEDGQGGTLPAQPYHAAVAYSAQGDEAPILELRRQIETVLTTVGFDVEFRDGQAHRLDAPQRAAEIFIGGKNMASSRRHDLTSLKH